MWKQIWERVDPLCDLRSFGAPALLVYDKYLQEIGFGLLIALSFDYVAL